MVRTTSGAHPLAAGEDPAAQAAKLDATFDDRIQLAGVLAPAEVKAGEPFAVTLYWRVLGDVFGDPKVFVHAAVPGAEMHQASGDHKALDGKSAPLEWKKGDWLVDTFRMSLPPTFGADKAALLVGWYEGDKRWDVAPASAQDGKNRALAATVKVAGGLATELVVHAPRRKTPIVIDGKLDEPAWESAAKTSAFVPYDGRTNLQNPTTARITWDEQNLYLAFECVDGDAFTPYTKRDDPLYNSEAVEIFVDADGDKDEYVELQSAPNDLHFDAAFKGGRRQNFDTKYDVNYETKTIVDGTVNNGADVDKGWISEWRIPIAELRDVPRAPQPGDQWKINLFRLDRIRQGERIVKNEASAWSTPLSGDFHNLDRFGTLVFDP